MKGKYKKKKFEHPVLLQLEVIFGYRCHVASNMYTLFLHKKVFYKKVFIEMAENLAFI